MIQDISQIPGFPDVMHRITAVSDIFDLCIGQESVLCFTLSLRDHSFVNVQLPYHPLERSIRNDEVHLLHDNVLQYIQKLKTKHKIDEEPGTIVSGRKKTTKRT